MKRRLTRLILLLTLIFAIGLTMGHVYAQGFPEEYFYDDNGDLYEGWVEYNENTYYVYYGSLARGVYPIYDNNTGDNCYYRFDNEGRLVKQEGWLEDDDGKWYYFDANGKGYTGWVLDYNGHDYYILLGLMQTGPISIYDEASQESIYYNFNNLGQLVRQEGWAEDRYGNRFYFDSNGIGYNGWKVLDGEKYYFINGDYYADSFIVLDDDDTYYFNEQGHMHTGWLKYEYGYYDENDEYVHVTSWYYFDEDGKGHNGWLEYGGHTYYIEYGSMLTGVQWIVGESYEDSNHYNFDSNGVLIKKNAWAKDDEGYWCYFNSDGSGYNGWLDYNGYKYYLDKGRTYVGFDYIKGVLYYFNAEGVMQTGWIKAAYYYEGEEKWYYFDSDGAAYHGWLEQAGKKYYIMNGEMVSGVSYLYSAASYYRFNDSGHLITTKGWVKEDGNWYYFNSDGSGYQGWLVESGKSYYIDSGKMATGIYDVLEDKKTYRFNDLGHLITTKGWLWVEEYDSWYYFNADGSGYQGWLASGGHWYYIRDGRMATGLYYVYEDGKSYNFNSAGQLITKAGWYSHYGIWYYFNSGGAGRTGWLASGGKWYYIDDGRMLTGLLYLYDEDGDVKETYNLNDSGQLIEKAGWYKIKLHYRDEDETWHYFDEGGKGHNGWLELGGYWYYIDQGRMLSGLSLIRDEAKSYNFADNGVLKYTSGWSRDKSGNYVYLNKDGSGYHGWLKDNNRWYYIDRGYMATGVTYVKHSQKLYFFNEKYGQMEYKKGWFKSGEYWYYGNGDGSLKTGWLASGGKWYYLDEYYGSMETYISYIDGYLYGFNSDGSLIDKETIIEQGYSFLANGRAKEGWFEENGSKYYYTEGYKAEGITKADDGYYYNLDSRGRLITNKAGWYMDYYRRYYFDSNGKGVTGWQNIDGKQVYTQFGEMLSWGIYQADGYLYEFARDGQVIELIKGWKKAENIYGGIVWYYAKSDGRVHKGWLASGGKWYYIDDNGRMLTEGDYLIDGKIYIFKEDGTLANGWAKRLVDTGYSNEHVLLYANPDGTAKHGWFKVDGKWYYANQGEVIRELDYFINGYLYNFTRKGVWIP